MLISKITVDISQHILYQYQNITLYFSSMRNLLSNNNKQIQGKANIKKIRKDLWAL